MSRTWQKWNILLLFPTQVSSCVSQGLHTHLWTSQPPSTSSTFLFTSLCPKHTQTGNIYPLLYKDFLQRTDLGSRWRQALQVGVRLFQEENSCIPGACFEEGRGNISFWPLGGVCRGTRPSKWYCPRKGPLLPDLKEGIFFLSSDLDLLSSLVRADKLMRDVYSLSMTRRIVFSLWESLSICWALYQLKYC